jgi:acetaldehyde dehydrogenase/alcohol dehydrogenase
MPHVIRYNALKPTKFTSFPKYKHFIADERYAEIAQIIGVGGKTTEESVENLVQAIKKLTQELNMPMSIETNGVSKADFDKAVDKLADRAFGDQCTPANPKMPLVSELADIYRAAFKGI